MPKDSRTWFDPPEGTAEEQAICCKGFMKNLYIAVEHGDLVSNLYVSDFCVSQSYKVLFWVAERTCRQASACYNCGRGRF